MNSKVSGQVVNYKYWQSLKSVETSQKETKPTKEGKIIMFHKSLFSQLKYFDVKFSPFMAIKI